VYVIYEQPGRQIGRFALRGDRTLFLFVLARDSDPRSYPYVLGAQKALLRDAFAADEWEFPQILEALDSCTELYFDRVSQIRMDTWSRGRVGLIGDAAFCVSLLAGQGSALAMTAAYLLAEELERANGDYRAAFRRYEDLLRPYIVGKQKAAVRFASSFAPKTQLGLIIRHLVMNAFRIPVLAKFAIGRDLVADRFELPRYTFWGTARASEYASARRFLQETTGNMSNNTFKVLIGLMTAPTMAFAPNALAQDTTDVLRSMSATSQ
jgi:2-polyprenyl-6-methoxyphenol hydroxylase-like FAD-dependent oxidoreductase